MCQVPLRNPLTREEVEVWLDHKLWWGRVSADCVVTLGLAWACCVVGLLVGPVLRPLLRRCPVPGADLFVDLMVGLLSVGVLLGLALA